MLLSVRMKSRAKGRGFAFSIYAHENTYELEFGFVSIPKADRRDSEKAISLTIRPRPVTQVSSLASVFECQPRQTNSRSINHFKMTF